MKDEKFKKVLLTTAKIFNKKVSALLPLGIGLIAGVIKYISCQTLQCAMGYFISGSLIAAIVISVLNAALRVICAKITKSDGVKDTTPETQENETLLKNNDLEDK